MKDPKITSGARDKKDPSPIIIEPSCGCNPAIAEAFIGETFTEELYAEIKRLANGSPVRPMGPGYVGTMDVRPERMNINVDSAKRIVSITCG